ncbi:cell wall hydrolase [Sphingomonas sp.]|uniref:cell wall hydrolase n=1 Tax=Sphingomonas sp. TaxID=28214 RepID=UPI0025F8DEA7|nr:cell wall hydrolase [Sphingomonas sp.]
MPAAGPLIVLALALVAVVAAAAAAFYLTRAEPAKTSRRAVDVAVAAPPVVLPQSDPKALRPLTHEQAVEWNDAIPVAKIANPMASAFSLGTVNPGDFSRSLDCMTAAIYYEAASESDDGQRAVAQVVLNRVRHPAFPHSVCGVVFQGYERRTGCQFSFSCDGALKRRVSQVAWNRARLVAARALSGSVFAPVGWATHYHTDWVAPYWSNTLVKTVQIGAHIFYRWQGRWGTPPAFTARYASAEPVLQLPLGAAVDATTGLAAMMLPGEMVTVTTAERPILSSDRVLAKAGFATGATSVAAASPAAAAPVTERSVASSERPVFGAGGAGVSPPPATQVSKK